MPPAGDCRPVRGLVCSCGCSGDRGLVCGMPANGLAGITGCSPASGLACRLGGTLVAGRAGGMAGLVCKLGWTLVACTGRSIRPLGMLLEDVKDAKSENSSWALGGGAVALWNWLKSAKSPFAVGVVVGVLAMSPSKSAAGRLGAAAVAAGLEGGEASRP